MARKEKERIVILCQNLNYDIQNDFSLNFLKETFGIHTTYLYRLCKGSAPKWLFSKLLLFTRRIYPKIGHDLFARFYRFIYNETWAKNLLSQFNASALVLDFHKASRYSTKFLTEAAIQKRIPVIMITHGVTMRLSGFDKQVDLPYADYKILPNDFKVKFYKRDTDSESTFKILGSPRYCDEWERLYNSLLEKRFSCPRLSGGKGELKVLFFGRPGIGFYEDHDAFQEVCKLNFVIPFFKGKPRIEGARHRTAGTGLNCPSARLIQWADVVVMSISSIVLEALWQKKPLIYLKYLAPHDNCVFEMYGACWPVNSQTDLINALKKLSENPEYRPYRQEDVDKLFEDVVYAGDRSRDVLKDHSDFLFSITGISAL